jgi:hypothetical protein
MKRAKLKHKAEERKAHTGKAAQATGRSGEGLKMAEEIVRCPYCILDDHFRPMLQKPESWFLCSKCGHTTIPDKPDFKCFCQKCGELNRAA